MKKIYLLGILATVLAFTSCSIEKRHYMNGYHVTWNHKTPTPDQKNNAAVTETPAPAAAQSEAPVVVAPVTDELTPIAVPVQTTQEGKAVITITEKIPALTKTSIQENSTVSDVKQFVQKKAGTTTEKPAAPHDKVLLVILAILLPPLAVYLHEGSWNGRCWLNLVLTLLCGIPGMIHALIVVLGD